MISTISPEFMAAANGSIVYTCRDADGAPIYVGKSNSPFARFAQHANTTPWWGEVDSIVVVAVVSPEDADRLEADLIFDLQPTHNVHGRTKRLARTGPPPRPMRGWTKADAA